METLEDMAAERDRLREEVRKLKMVLDPNDNFAIDLITRAESEILQTGCCMRSKDERNKGNL